MQGTMIVNLIHLFILFEVAVLVLAQPGGQIQHCCQNDLCPADCQRCDGTPTCYDLSDELGCSDDADNKLLSYRKPPVFVPFVMNILKSGLRREKMELYRKNPNHACFSTSRETTTEMPLWEQLLRKLQGHSGVKVPANGRSTTMTPTTTMPVWKLLLHKLRGQTTTAQSLVTPMSEVTTIMYTQSPSIQRETSAINRIVDNETITTPTTTGESLITTAATEQTTRLDTSSIPVLDATTSATTIPTRSLDLNEMSQTSQSTESSSLQTTKSDLQSINQSLHTRVDTEKSSAASGTHSITEDPVSYQSTTSLPPTTPKHIRMGIAVSISSDFATNVNNTTQTNTNATSFSLVTTTTSDVFNTSNGTSTNSNSTTEQSGPFQALTKFFLLNTTRVNSTIQMSENNTDYGESSVSTAKETHLINESSSSQNESAAITLRPQETNSTVFLDASIESTNISSGVNVTSETDESVVSIQTNRTSSFPTSIQTEDITIGNLTYNNITHYPTKDNTSILQLDTRDNNAMNETMSHEVDTVSLYNIATNTNDPRVPSSNDTQNAKSLSLNITNDKNNSSIAEYSVHEAVLKVNRTENRNSYNTSNNDNSATVSIVSNDGNIEARENVLKNKVASETSYMSPDNEIRIILEKLHALAEMEEKNMSLRPKLSEFNVKHENNLEKGNAVDTKHKPSSSPSPTTAKSKADSVKQQPITETPKTVLPGRASGSSSPKTTTEVINARRKSVTAPPPAPWPRSTFFDFNLNELLGFTSVSPLDLGFYRSSPNPLSWDAFFGDIGGVPVTHNNEFPSTGTNDNLSNVNNLNVDKSQFPPATLRALNKENIRHESSTKSNKIIEYIEPTIRTGSVKSTLVPTETARNHQTTTTERYWTLTTNSIVTPEPSTQSPITAASESPRPSQIKLLKSSPLPQNHPTHLLNPSTQHLNPSAQPPNLSTQSLNPSIQPPNPTTQPAKPSKQASTPSTQPQNPTNQPPIPSTRLPKPSVLPSNPTPHPSKPSILPPTPSTQEPPRNHNAESSKKDHVQSTTSQPISAERRNNVSVTETNAILPVESISSWWQKVYSTPPPAVNTSPLDPTTYLPYTAQEQCYEIHDVSGFCQTRSGHYNNPSDCRTFYVCMWGYLHRCSCPPNTMFDSKIQVCNWDNLVTCVK